MLTPNDIETQLSQRRLDIESLQSNARKIQAGINNLQQQINTLNAVVPSPVDNGSNNLDGIVNVVGPALSVTLPITFNQNAIFLKQINIGNASPVAFIKSVNGDIEINAGGTNQSITLTPSGSGGVLITLGSTLVAQTPVLTIPNFGSINTFDSAGGSRPLLFMDNANPDVVHIGNRQRASGGAIVFERAGAVVTATINTLTGFNRFGDATAGSYAVDSAGDVNAVGVFRKGGTAGLSVTRNLGSSLTVNTVANGLIGTPAAGQSNTTLVTSVTLNLTTNTFSGGILTV